MTSNGKGGNPSYGALYTLLFLVFVVWLVSGLLLYGRADRGTLGDMFGAVNSLFSGLAFAALVYTINLQKNELALQRQELSLTRSEIEGQKLQMVAQNELLKIQGFESSFFRVLQLLSEISGSFDIVKQDGSKVVGRDCFATFFKSFRGSYSTSNSAHPNLSEEKRISRSYEEFYARYQGDVGHYFRTLYNLVKLVDKSHVQDKHFYTNLIRAQLSSQELLLLFYNCQTSLGREKFKPLVEKYALLKTVQTGDLIDASHRDLYSPGAYGKPVVIE